MKAQKGSERASPESEAVYIDDVEAARRTSIARATFQKMRHEGSGPPYFKVGRSCLYRWSDVVAWIESHRKGAGDAIGGRRLPRATARRRGAP